MPSSLHHRSLWSAQRLSARDLARLIEIAERLRRLAAGGHAIESLAGRHLALVGPLDAAAVQSFIEAAHALGAQVARVDAGALTGAAAQRLPELARLLGRLYQGVDCCGLAPALINQIDEHAGVPVLNGLADPGHPLRLLGDLLTMQAWSGRPLRELQLELADATVPGARALLELAPLASLRVQVPALATAGAGGELPRCDFAFVAGRTVAERLRLPEGDLDADRALATLAQTHDRLAIQALLVAAMN